MLKWLKLLHYKGIAIVKMLQLKKSQLFRFKIELATQDKLFLILLLRLLISPNQIIQLIQPCFKNHMDLPWLKIHQGYQFLHCLVNSADGGDSSAVDGFAVSGYLKKNEKEIFETLVNIPLKFRDKDYTQETIRNFHAPAISLTKRWRL